MIKNIENYVGKIAKELNLAVKNVQASISLLEGGASVPFIARYRKEMTGSLDEVAITSIRDRLAQLRDLDDRREVILNSLEERELLTDELKEKILEAETMSELEDIYLPYRPKRRTRATIAKEKGLEPLAELIFEQGESDPSAEAEAFIDTEKGVERFERKFYLGPKKVGLAYGLLRQTCIMDSRYPSEQINSLYFDTSDMDQHERSCSGDFKKDKVRIRWYGEDKDMDGMKTIFIELKSKRGFASTKQRFKLLAPSENLAPDNLGKKVIPKSMLVDALARFGYFPNGILLPVIINDTSLGRISPLQFFPMMYCGFGIVFAYHFLTYFLSAANR